MKNKEIQIFIYGHKNLEYGYWDNLIYTPLEVGAEMHDVPVLDMRDNTGENISAWNGAYGEVTGLYWIWRQIAGQQGSRGSGAKAGAQGSRAANVEVKGLKYVGTCQYRRRLEFAEDTDFKAIFKDNDIIVAKPLRLGWSLKQQYKNCHNVDDIEFAESIVKELYPDYAEDWDKYINQEGVIYYSSGMVMKKKDFVNYCKWLFSIFDEYKQRKGFNKPEDIRNYIQENIIKGKHKSTRGLDYQQQIFGFLQERLFSLYVRHNFKKPLEIEYKKYEGV